MKRGKGRPAGLARWRQNSLLRRAGVARRRVERSHPVMRALAWAIIAGTPLRVPEYADAGLGDGAGPVPDAVPALPCGLLMLPLVLRAGLAATGQNSLASSRVAACTRSALLWFTAIALHHPGRHHRHRLHGADLHHDRRAWVFGEKMRWERWIAALIGFGGVRHRRRAQARGAAALTRS